MDKNINEDIVIVGIGASAGGLEALQSFVQNVPKEGNVSYIIAQHLSPTYKSMMVELLQKESPLEVLEAQNGLIAKVNTIYICPPNENITIVENMIQLSKPNTATYSPKPSVDLLFESIAKYKKNKAIGIILSGTGSDGSRGIRAIKAEGGFTIAQEPESAKYDGMPISAINTGNIDMILAPEQIGNELFEIMQYPIRVQNTIKEEDKQKYNNIYKNILTKLGKETKVDFSLYKSTTIVRRIERRMTTLKITSVIDYNNYLLKQPEEIYELFKDILIGVTSFFRDQEPFSVLEELLKNYFKINEEKVFRAWIPGCSTGEEAYSIAMVLSEVLGANIAHYKVQIFASDLDLNAIESARKGLYPESAILDIPKKFKSKYFTVKGEQFEVIKPIKEMVIFSKHDITRDPPFLRLDLISCRNLLIYFTPELQKKIFPVFHYSLKSSGFLLLGKSESVGQFQNYFKTIDKKWKLYEATYLGKKNAPILINNFVAEKYKEPKAETININIPSMSDILVSKIQEFILPSSIIINEMMDIVYLKGKNNYLVRPDGDATDNIYKNINQTLSVELRSAINDARLSKKPTKSKYQKILLENQSKFVRIIVVPVFEEINVPPLFIIFFQEEEIDHIYPIDLESIGNDDEKVQQIELELIKTREQLQTVIEELETSNEEMQSMNEELQSSNEELQSSNEELETTNEELQSTNEELQTAYSELRASYDEKQEQKNELYHLQKKLQKVNSLLDESQSLAKMASWEWDIDTQSMIWSNNFFTILGIENGKFEPSYEALMGMIYYEDKGYVEHSFQDALKGNSIFDITFRLQTKNKDTIKVKAVATVIFDENKEAKKMVGNIINITEQIELENSYMKLFELVDMSLDGKGAIVKCDKNEKIIALNSIALEKLNIKENQIIGKNIDGFMEKIDFKRISIPHKQKDDLILFIF